MIHFIKIAPYMLRPEGEEVFSYLSDLTAQRINPPSEEPSTITAPSPVVFHSTLKRSSECLKILPGQKAVPLAQLNEIPFELPAVCTRVQWEMEGSVAVRRGFLQAFVADSLLVKREQLFEEVEEVLKKVARASRRESHIAFLQDEVV